MPVTFYKAFILMMVSSLAIGWAGVPAAQAVQGPGLQLSDEDSQGLTLELTTPDFRIEQGQADGQACQIIRIDGYGSTDTPGYPELPIRGLLCGIPPLSNPVLTQSEPGVGTIAWTI